MLDHMRMAYAYVSEAVGDRAIVEMQLMPDSADTYPLVVVSTSPPSYVRNGPLGAAHQFRLYCSVYGRDVIETWDLALEIEHNIQSLYQRRFTTPYGGITHISRVASSRPNRVPPSYGDPTDDTIRVDFDFYVTARAPVASGDTEPTH